MKRGRISLADQLARNQASLDAYRTSGQPRVVLHTPEPPKPPRAARKASGRPLEKDVQAAILEAIRAHPKVAWCGRINRGVAVSTNADGSMRYTAFNTIVGMSDLLGQMRDGRMLAIEVKRDHHGRPTQDQAAFIAKVNENNGVAGLCYSVDGVYAILDNA